MLTLYMGRFELPLLWRMCDAFANDEDAAPWNTMYCLGRDTSEGRAETLQMGYSLTSLLRDLGCFDRDALSRLERHTQITFPLAFAWAATAWKIPAAMSVQAYAWSWLENQVAASMKAIPVGQVAGQKNPLSHRRAYPRRRDAGCEFAPKRISVISRRA